MIYNDMTELIGKTPMLELVRYTEKNNIISEIKNTEERTFIDTDNVETKVALFNSS